MAKLTNLTPTTETEALNTILAALGEAPMDSIDIATGTDVEIIINTLRETAVGVQSEGWQFNTDLGLELVPDDTFDWTDNDGVATTLNVWVPTADLISWDLARTANQRLLRLTERPSKRYAGGGTKVFYDQARNRDGLDKDEFDYLYIDAVFLFDFEDLPTTARDYITKLSAVRAAARIPSDQQTISFTASDVQQAYRRFYKEQVMRDRYNIFDSSGRHSASGGRYRPSTGRIQDYTL